MQLATRRQGALWPPENAPAGLIQQQASAPRLVAVNQQAADQGLRCGMVLADARAILPSLLVRDAEPEADAKALRALAEWCLRYTPKVALDGCEITPFALMLDITGCAHLLGGEQALMADLETRLAVWGLSARMAIADGQARAWALARHSTPEELHELPVAALRLERELAASLRRLGLKRVGDLADMPRRALLNRFPSILVERLEALLHTLPERFEPLREVPHISASLGWAEPIATTEGIEAAMHALVERITRELDDAVRGARHLCLVCCRIDGDVRTIALALGRPQRDATHIARLFAMRLDGFDVGFGIELMRLEVTDNAPLPTTQSDLVTPQDQTALARLADQLRLRLGAGRVQRLQPVASHIPEHAQKPIEADQPIEAAPWLAEQPRPLRLLAEPARLEAMAEAPDGPPLRLTLNRCHQRVIAAVGPERIEPEWWRLEDSPQRTRDYWRTIDDTGATHWLFRAGHYDDPEGVRWYRHGSFE